MATYFKVSTNKSPIAYTVGEEIIFDITVRSHKEGFNECRRFKWEIQQDDGKTLSGEDSVLMGKKHAFIKTSLSRPGFVKIHRSYIVNLSQVSSLSAEGCLLFTGENLPISRLLFHQVRERYMRHLFSHEEVLKP